MTYDMAQSRDNRRPDEYDIRIIELLKENARMGYTEIGEKVGLSRVAVKNRIDGLEKCGIIKGYRVKLDMTASPNRVRFILDIEVMPDQLEAYAEEISHEKRIRQIYLGTGTGRLHVLGCGSSNEDVAAFVRRIFNKSKGVIRIKWDILTTELKDTDNGIEFKRCQEE